MRGRTRWIVGACFVIWPLLILISMIYCKTALDLNGGIEITTGKGSVSNSSSTNETPQDKSLGGLLAAGGGGSNEESCLSRHQSTLYRKASPHKTSSHLTSRLLSYEHRHRRCGPHTESYNKTLKHLMESSGHRSAAEMGSCKYVVHLWMSHSGIGNRLLSLASSFLYAILTDRVLLIEQNHDMADLLCEPFPEGTWKLPSDFPIGYQLQRLNQKSPHCYGNLLKKKRIPDTLNLQFLYLHLIYDYNDYDKLFFCDRYQSMMKEVDWLILRSDQYFVPSLFLIPSFEKELRKLFPERETVFHHLSRYLLHPSNRVWGLVKRYFEAYLAKSEEKIGIQIRDFSSTDLPFHSLEDHIARYYLPHMAVNKKKSIFNGQRNDSYDLNSPLLYMMDRILDCSVQRNLLPQVIGPRTSVSKQPKTNPKTKSVLVTSLNSRYFENLRKIYSENPTIKEEVIRVYQPSHEEFQQNGNSNHNMKALAEIYLLSLVDVLITSPWSTFGYVAQGLGALKPWILNNPQKQILGPEPACHRAKSMEPCFHYPPFYDCEANKRVDTEGKVLGVGHCEDTSWGIKLFGNHEL